MSSSPVGWSDISFFSIFENSHYAAKQLYFYEFNSQKSANLAARAAKFSFPKNQRNLKIIFLKTICKYLPFTSKNNRQKEKKIIKIIIFILFLDFQNLVLDLGKGKINLLKFLFFFKFFLA